MGYGGADGFHVNGGGDIPPEFGDSVLIVSKNPNAGQFSTIEAALASITTNSATNPYLIYVEPGVFVENQLQMKQYVYIQGSGDIITVVRAAPALNDSKFILGIDNAQIADCFIDGGTSFAGLGSNQVGVYLSGIGTGNSFIIKACVFGKHYTCAWAEGVSAATILRLSNIRAGGAISTFVTYLKVTNAPGIPTIGYADQLSYAKSGGTFPTDMFFGHGVGVQLAIINCIVQTTVIAPTNFINAYDGVQIVCTNSSFSRSNGIGVYIPNSGVAPLLNITGLTLSQITSDIQVDHIMASGEIQGSFRLDNLILASTDVSVFGVDPNGGGIVASNQISLIFDDGTITDITTSIIETSPMGLISGGVLTDGGGLNVNVSAYSGYCSTGVSPTKVLRLEKGGAQVLPLPPNLASYIYITSTNLLTSNAAIPDTTQNILLGRVVTDGANVIIINTTPLDTRNISNSFDDLLRNALGSIYASGSITSENVTPFKLNVSSGTYFFAENEFNPAGGLPITFMDYVNGASIGNTDTINHTQYDNAGVLTPYTAGFYGKSTLYISGDGIYEKYLVVRSQQQFATLLAAQQADLPLPPGYFDEGVTLIAAVIIQQGAVNISQVIDSRPVIGFKASGVNASADHTSLLNLNTGNAGHFQFMMLNGSTPMAGTLDMAANPITNVSTVNGILPADWYKNGGNTFGANATIGLIDNFSFGIRTNNTDRITISAAGVVGIPNLGGGGSTIVVADNTGTLVLGATTSILPEGSNLYFTDARVIAAPLTGFAVGANTTITAADSILLAFGKTQGQINAIAAGTVLSITGTANRISIAGTAQDPVIDIAATYVGQASITTLGTITTGVWNGSTILTNFTEAQVIDITGTANRISIGLSGTHPTVDISAAYVGQVSIEVLGTVTVGTWNATPITTGFTQAQVISVLGTANRISIGGTANNPVVNIDAAYIGQASIDTLGTITIGTWNAVTILTGFTEAQVINVAGTANRISIGGTTTNPTINISATYVGQASITTLGTITSGVWDGATILTGFTQAQVIAITGTANRISIGGTATNPTVNIDAAYVGQATITTLGTITTGVWDGTVIGTAFTTAQVISVAGTANRISIGGTSTNPVVNIDAAYIGQASITTLGTITTGVWNGTTIATGFTQAQVISVTGTANRISIGGTATNPTINIDVAYVGQASITTLGTITTGVWNGTTIATGFTQAQVISVTGTAGRISIGGTATNPTVDIDAAYIGQASITTLGTITTGVWNGTAIADANIATPYIKADGTRALTANWAAGAFQISANGVLVGSAANTISTAAAGNLTIVTGTTGNLSLDSGTTGAVTIGTGASAKTITIGNITGVTAVNFNTGTGGSTFTTTNGIFTLVTGTGAINIGTDAVAKTITIGNSTGVSGIIETVGTGGYTLNGVGASNYSFAAATTTGTIVIGGTTQSGAIQIGGTQSTSTISIGASINTNQINIGNGAGASTIFIGSAGAAAGIKTINIGVNQADNVITIGTATGVASVTINTGTGGFTVLTATTGTVSIKSGTTGAVTFDSGTTGAVNIGNGANAKAITIGNGTGATSITLASGTGAINIGVAIAKTITIGNVTGATAVNINTGTAGSVYTTTNGVFTLVTGTGTISLGSDAAAKTISIGTGAVANTITIGSATVNNTINLSANKIGMYGVAAIARQAAITPPAGGLVVDANARAAINTLITTLQTLGITL